MEEEKMKLPRINKNALKILEEHDGNAKNHVSIHHHDFYNIQNSTVQLMT